MKFLITEIALYLAAAGVLGLIIGWLMKASGAKRRINAINAAAETRLKSLETEKNSVISALTDEKESLASQNAQLANDAKQAATALAQVDQKRVAVTSELEKTRDILDKTQAEARMLGGKVESQQETMRKARIEVEQLATQQDELQVKLASIRESKDREISALEKQIKAFAGHSTTQTAAAAGIAAGSVASDEVARRARLEEEARAQQAAADELNTRIDSLAQEREQLMREREEVISRTRQFESQLQASNTDGPLSNTDRTFPAADAEASEHNRFQDTSFQATSQVTSQVTSMESDLDQSMEIDEPEDIFDDAGLQSVIEESTSPATEFDHGLSSYDRFDESFDNIQPNDSTQDATLTTAPYSDPLRDRLNQTEESGTRPTLWDRVRSSVVKSDSKN